MRCVVGASQRSGAVARLPGEREKAGAAAWRTVARTHRRGVA